MACGKFTFSLHPQMFRPTRSCVCCLCGSLRFEIHSRLPLDRMCFTCPSCAHLMFEKPLAFPLVYKGCASCHHSCATCSDGPPLHLVVQIVCQACLACTRYVYQPGDMTNGLWRGFDMHTVSSGTQRNTPCPGCRYTPPPVTAPPTTSTPNKARYRILYTPIPIAVLENVYRK